MQLFRWLAILILLGVAIFAVQNSTAPAVELKFLAWSLGTSIVYTILGSLVTGMLVILLLWIPFALKNSRRRRNLQRRIDTLEREKSSGAKPTGPGVAPP